MVHCNMRLEPSGHLFMSYCEVVGFHGQTLRPCDAASLMVRAGIMPELGQNNSESPCTQHPKMSRHPSRLHFSLHAFRRRACFRHGLADRAKHRMRVDGELKGIRRGDQTRSCHATQRAAWRRSREPAAARPAARPLRRRASSTGTRRSAASAFVCAFGRLALLRSHGRASRLPHLRRRPRLPRRRRRRRPLPCTCSGVPLPAHPQPSAATTAASFHQSLVLAQQNSVTY